MLATIAYGTADAGAGDVTRTCLHCALGRALRAESAASSGGELVLTLRSSEPTWLPVSGTALYRELRGLLRERCDGPQKRDRRGKQGSLQRHTHRFHSSNNAGCIRAHIGFRPRCESGPLSPSNPRIVPSCAIVTAMMIRVRRSADIA